MGKGISSTLFAILLVPCAWPQSGTGTVSGTVRDQSGAVVPNAAMTLTNTATNVSSSTRSNEVGFYFYPAVVSGSYRLSVETPGMEKFEGTFIVQVTQSVVIEPVLRPGQTTTAVVVRDVTPMVTVDNPTVRTTMERERIEQLPINGRQITNLLATLPGYEGGRVFGTPAAGQEWILDGAVVSERRWSTGAPLQPPLDSIEEFTVEANAVSARLTRPVNIVLSTKSGTNQFHGSAFETHRNNAIGLARSRTDFYERPPQLIRNEFGASAGAPVILPKLYNGKDRTFWFFGYEATRTRSASTVGFPVPTAAMRAGDFSGLVDSQGRRSTLYDPWSTNTTTLSRQPFAHGGRLNVIDPARLSPVAKYMFEITPLPTHNVNPLIDHNFWGPQRSRLNRWNISNRFDHRLSSGDQLYARLQITDNVNDYHTTAGGTGQQMLNGVAGWERNTNYVKSLAISWVRTFSPTFFSELLVSGKRNEWFGGEVGEGENDWHAQLGLPNLFNVKRWPQIQGTGLTVSNINYQLITNDTKLNYENNYIVDNNFTKIQGRHDLQFGVHFRHDFLNILPQQRFPAAQLNFGTNATALYDPASTPQNPLASPFSGHNLANMFLGLSSYGNSLQHNWYYLRGKELALYLQDNFKMTSRLTLNLGLRWEYWSPYSEKNGSIVGFDRNSTSVVLGNSLDRLYALGATRPSLIARYQSLGRKFATWDQVGLPRGLVDSRKDNFAPRLGFAYKGLDGKSSFVLRGGYSIAFFRTSLHQWLDNNRSNLPMAAFYGYNPNDVTQSPDGLGNYMMRTVPTVVAGVNSRNVVDIDQPRGITRGSGTVSYFARNQPDARSHTWNLTLEKEVMANTVARARYIGTHSSGLNQYYNYNDSTPEYIWYVTTGEPLPTGDFANVARRFYDRTASGGLQEYRQTGFANTNGLELEMERRFHQGYGFQLSYVIVNALTGTADVPEINQFLPGAVPTGYDERNQFLGYQRDTGIPKHRVRWNWLVELPVGKGKWLGRNANGFLDKLIGGWQLAGIGNVRSNYFTLPTGNWNFTGEKVQIYGYKYPIEDCRGGSCIPGYLWWNGYIPTNQINSRDSSGRPNGFMGVPSNYKPAVTPLIPWGSTALPANAPANTNIQSFWDTNNVWIPLKNGTVQRVGYNPNLNAWRNQYMPGVRQWGLDASLFKNIPVGERFAVRFNADFFNVLNAPGNPNTIGENGFLNTRNSGNSPRTLQLTLRLSW